MRKKNLKTFIIDNIVTIIFLSLTIIGVLIAKQPISILVNDLVQRAARNTFIVLALIIPVLAGLGLNFGIVVGAMAAQMSIIFVMDMGWNGLGGLIAAMVLSIPLSVLFGWMIGKLLNKTRGQEMITSLLVGLFAQGLYQLVYLVLMGPVIPVRTKEFLIPGGQGIRNTINLGDGAGIGIKYSLSNLINLPFFLAVTVVMGLVTIFFLYKYLTRKKKVVAEPKNYLIRMIISAVVTVLAFLGHSTMLYPKALLELNIVYVPLATFMVILVMALIINWLIKTKLGQDFRSVGQSQTIAGVAGINVDRTRIIAMIFSTIIAGLGHILLLENVGVLNTYGSHVSIGLYGVATLLVGGATVNKANVGQAFLGVVIFHTLFYIAPFAGKVLLNDAQNGEYFRNIIAYGAIGLSLVLYAWKSNQKPQPAEATGEGK